MIAVGYLDAAVENARAARACYEATLLAPSMYLSGLSLECVLRAYRVRIDPEFDSRHNLHDLLRISRFDQIIPASDRKTASSALSVILNTWSNAHRFKSSVALRKELARRRYYEGIRGDFLKEFARRMMESAAVLTKLGVQQWQTR